MFFVTRTNNIKFSFIYLKLILLQFNTCSWFFFSNLKQDAERLQSYYCLLTTDHKHIVQSKTNNLQNMTTNIEDRKLNLIKMINLLHFGQKKEGTLISTLISTYGSTHERVSIDSIRCQSKLPIGMNLWVNVKCKWLSVC